MSCWLPGRHLAATLLVVRGSRMEWIGVERIGVEQVSVKWNSVEWILGRPDAATKAFRSTGEREIRVAG